MHLPKKRSTASRLDPWPPAKATKIIWAKANDAAFTICWTDHARDQIRERDLIMGDVLYVLQKGYIYKEGEPATRTGLYKYEMESKTPNSTNRTVRVIVIPSPQSCEVKIASVMWADEAIQSS